MKILIGIVLGLIVLLFSVGFLYLGSITEESDTDYFSRDKVRFTQTLHAEHHYTLSYDQQDDLFSLLNDGEVITINTSSDENEAPPTIIVRRFRGLSDIVLTALKTNLSLFHVTGDGIDFNLAIKNSNDLRELLEEVYK